MYGGFSRLWHDDPAVKHLFLDEDETYMMKLNMHSHLWEPVRFMGESSTSQCQLSMVKTSGFMTSSMKNGNFAIDSSPKGLSGSATGCA